MYREYTIHPDGCYFFGLKPVFMRSKWNFFAERNLFLAAKTEISCRKEIFRRVGSGWKAGFVPFFSSVWRLSAYRFHLTFCDGMRRKADSMRDTVRISPSGGFRLERETPSGLSSWFFVSAWESRISVRVPPGGCPCDSRASAFDTLTLWHFDNLPPLAIYNNRCIFLFCGKSCFSLKKVSAMFGGEWKRAYLCTRFRGRPGARTEFIDRLT